MFLNAINQKHSKQIDDIRKRARSAGRDPPPRRTQGFPAVSKRNLRPIKLGLVVGSREFFNAAPTLETRKELVAHLDRLKISYSILPLEATKNGAVQSRDDARLYARHFREQRDSIDGLVICLPNFGDEIAISELVNEARLNVPIVLQASNDEVDKVDVHSRRDAFCGKFSVTNNFYQYGVRFTDTTSHTSDIAETNLHAISIDLSGRVASCVASAMRGSARSARAPGRSRRCDSARSSCRRPASRS